MLDLQSMDLKNEIKKLEKNDPGKVRAASLKSFVEFVKQKKGEEGSGKVVEELKRNGFKMPDVNKINNMEWIPSSMPTIYIIVAAKIFNWGEREIIETGERVVSFTPITRIYLKFFISIKKTFEIASKIWKKNYTFGELKILEIKPEQKYVKIKLTDNKRHPIMCVHLKGVFSKIVETATGSQSVTVKETKCEFLGDSSHEYIIRW